MIPVLFLFSFFASSAISNDLYSIDADTSLLAVVQPSSSQVRVQDGILQYNYAFGQYQNLTTDFATLLNIYNIATLDDVNAAALTVPDLMSAFNQYFGSLPSPDAAFNSESKALWYRPNTGHGFLNSSGSVTITPNSGLLSLTDLIAQGFMGVGKDIMTATGTYSYQVRLPAVSESYTTMTTSSLAESLGLIDFHLSRLLTFYGSSPILGQDGTDTQLSVSTNLVDLNRRSFLGLATILRGSSGNVATFNKVSSSDPSQSVEIQANNLLDAIMFGFGSIQEDIALLRYVQANDDDIQMREDMQQQYDSVVDNFTSPGGSGTPSASDIGDMAGISSGIGSLFSGSATVADAFNQLGSSDNYSYFSSVVAAELEPQNQFRQYSRQSDDGFVDFFQDQMNFIMGGLGSTW